MNAENVCLADSGTTHTILQQKKYFSYINVVKAPVSTISGMSNLIEGSGKTNFTLPNGTQFCIKDALYSSRSRRNLLSFKDIRLHGYHIETTSENDKEYLCITMRKGCHRHVLEKLPAYSSSLYCTTIKTIEAHTVVRGKPSDPKDFTLWHERLGHPGTSMMRRIIESSHGHSLKSQKVLSNNDYSCTACSVGKLIIRPSQTKVGFESPTFLERIHGDICGPIHPPSGPFRYFMVLIDASTRWSHVCLLSTRNVAFARLLAQIIKLRTQFSDHPIKSIRLDNAGEFTSKSFNDYCMAVGITVEHPVPHVHTQNGLAESLIKRLQLIARPLLLRSKLPISAWGHAILHAASLIRIRPTAYHKYSPLQLVVGQEPNINHLRVFGCEVYVPVTPPKRTKMGPQRRMGVYVGFDSPSIIRYLEPLTGDLFTARFADCHFDESVFPPLGGEQSLKQANGEISWKASGLFAFDQRTSQSDSEVRKIIQLQSIANKYPDAFVDSKQVIKSHIPAANVPARIEVPKAVAGKPVTTPQPRLKRGRPIGAKDTVPRKRKSHEIVEKGPSIPETDTSLDVIPTSAEQALPTVVDQSTSEIQNPENKEMSISYVHREDLLDRSTTVIDDIFTYSVALDIEINSIEDPEPQSITECKNRDDWSKWEDAIQAELSSLAKREVFGPIVLTPENIKPVGYKWVFVRKRNENGEIVRYKARLVAQGFSQMPGIDYKETYSPVMDGITFRFIIALAATQNLDMRLMDVVTAYLYGSLDSDIYMKVPEGYKMSATCSKNPRHFYSIKLQRSLYGLKQSGRMWYNRLSEYLIKEGYTNNVICPCVFIKKSNTGFAIIAVYVDDLNLVGTPDDLKETAEYLKKEFEMKDLGKTKYCLGIQVQYSSTGTFIHQSTYTEKVLKRFSMEKAHPLSSPMVVRSLDVNKDPFRPQGDGEDLLGPETPYLSAVGALMYLANCTRPDIAFSVNLLARYSAAPTRRHWNGVKHVLRYLRGTTDMGLFYANDSTTKLIGFADAGYLSDPHKARSQTGYVFTYGNTAISWRSTKQTLTATSSNHSEIVAFHEASRECVWLRSMIHHIQGSCGLSSVKETPTIMHEDNAACVHNSKEDS